MPGWARPAAAENATWAFFRGAVSARSPPPRKGLEIGPRSLLSVAQTAKIGRATIQLSGRSPHRDVCANARRRELHGIVRKAKRGRAGCTELQAKRSARGRAARNREQSEAKARYSGLLCTELRAKRSRRAFWERSTFSGVVPFDRDLGFYRCSSPLRLLGPPGKLRRLRFTRNSVQRRPEKPALTSLCVQFRAARPFPLRFACNSVQRRRENDPSGLRERPLMPYVLGVSAVTESSYLRAEPSRARSFPRRWESVPIECGHRHATEVSSTFVGRPATLWRFLAYQSRNNRTKAQVI